MHLTEGAPSVPIWLFATSPPLPETAALCERVYVGRNSLFLLFQAQIRLWPYWVAIVAITWTEERGRWALKLGPFFIPPFRVLLLNRWGGFFPGKPTLIFRHGRRFLQRVAIDGWTRTKEIVAGFWHSGPVRRTRDVTAAYWLLVSYHIWRSGPVRRVHDVGMAFWRLVSYHVWRSSTFRRVRDITSGAALLFLSTVLRWFSYPYRGWFKRMYGDQFLDARETVSSGGVDRFVQNGRGWNARVFGDFVHSSKAGWILWQESAGSSDAAAFEEASALFDDPRTFAVARQSEARGWKPALFAMAPFRHLQPGTVSSVLAPVAQTILVDRAKLASLGIPQIGRTHAAWMLLFWKAAAAGWRCYSVPSQDEPAWQPDFPQEETAFFLKFLVDRKLRQLGPREPDLSRGSISFAPALQLPLRPDRLKVVVVSPFLPYPLSHGGAVRIFNLCRALADHVDFILVAVREAHDVVPYEKLHEVFRHVYTVDIDEHESKDARLPRQVRAAQSASLRALITDVCERLHPDLLQIEFTHMAGYRDCAPGVPAVLVEHDLTFKLYCQLAHSEPSEAAWSEYRRWLEFEQHWLAAYDAVWTVSGEDCRDAIQEGSDPDRTFVVPNGVDVERFVPDEPAVGEICEVFYVGSFRHLPNILGFLKLQQEVMPRVWERIPNARLRVVAGPRHEHFWSRLSPKAEPLEPDPRIAMHGFVEDLRPLYARASVVVVPLEVSAGTNIKVLEAMACGKTVVTTPVGCAGLGLRDEEDAFIREGWEEFAETVCETLLNAPLRSRIGARARQMVEARFSWESIARTAHSTYAQLTLQEPRLATPAPLRKMPQAGAVPSTRLAGILAIADARRTK